MHAWLVRAGRYGERETLALEQGLAVRDADPSAAQQGQDASPTEETQEAEAAEEDIALDVTSVVDLLHMLEGVAGEGRDWFQGREWAGTWSADDEADRVEEGA